MKTQTYIFLAYILPIFVAVIFVLNLIISTVFVYGGRIFLVSTDFRAFYTAGQMLSNGVGADFYNLNTQYIYQHGFAPEVSTKTLMPFLNPPFAALPFALLSFLTFDNAYFAWIFVNLLLLFFILRLILKLIGSLPMHENTTSVIPTEMEGSFSTAVGLREIPRSRQTRLRNDSLQTGSMPRSLKVLTVVLILLFIPLWGALLQGQFSLILTLSVLQAYFALKSNKNFSTGLWLSLLFIRPHLVVVPALALLVGKRFLAFFGLVVGSSMLFLISLFLVGFKGLIGYTNLLIRAFSWGDALTIHPQIETTWRGFLQAIANSDYPGDIVIWWILGVIIAVGLLFWAWRKNLFEKPLLNQSRHSGKPSLAGRIQNLQGGKRFWARRVPDGNPSSQNDGQEDFDLAFALMIIVTIFVSPHTNYHDLTLFIIPGVLIVNYLSNRKKYEIQDKLLFLLLYFGYIVLTIGSQLISYGRLHLVVPFMILAMVILASRLVWLKKD